VASQYNVCESFDLEFESYPGHESVFLLTFICKRLKIALQCISERINYLRINSESEYTRKNLYISRLCRKIQLVLVINLELLV
jgi:hypothetical protein